MIHEHSFDRAFQGEIPLPLARLYARAHHAKGARERHDHAFHLVEVSIKLAASALVGRYRGARERSSQVDGALRHLALPSLGQWRDLFRETLGFLGKRADADGWSRALHDRLTERSDHPRRREIFDALARAAAYSGRRRESLSLFDLLDLLPTYRNAMSDAHGSIKADPAAYVNGTAALLELARLLLKDGQLLGGAHLLFSEEVKYGRAGERQVVWMDLTGPTAIRRQPFGGQPTAEEILPGQLFLEVGPADHLPLHPLLFYQPGELVDQVFFLNRARGGRSRIQFLSYATGDFYVPGRDPHGDELVRDLEALLSWVTGKEVGDDELEILTDLSREEAAEAGEKPAEAGADARAPARVFGDYEILRELGRGGMAVVYLARQLSLDRSVALKVLPIALRDNPVAVARFKQEVRALALCDHANVVKILSSGQAEGTWYYAMEFIDGADLSVIGRTLDHYRSAGATELREGHFELAASTAGASRGGQTAGDPTAGLPQVDAHEPRPPPLLAGGRDIAFRLAALIRDAARGVQHIHDHGIIHRDLKPQNIMVTRDRHQPVVMDLGLAKLGDVSQSLTLDRGRVLGTLRYMAPEQLQRHLLEVDARADVYALGAVLFELACHRPMLDGDSEERITAQVLFESPPHPQKVNPRLPGDLATIIHKATQKDPRERYSSAGALADDLDRFVHGEAIQARPPSLGYVLKLYLKRHRAALSSAGLAAVLLLGAFLAGRAYFRGQRYRQNFEDAERALAREDEGGLKSAMTLLQEEFAGDEGVLGLARKLEDLRTLRRAQASRDQRQEGDEHWERYLRSREEAASLEKAWKEAVERRKSWEPVWSRGEELSAWEKLLEARRGLEEPYHAAVISFSKALDLAPARTPEVDSARRALAQVFWRSYQEALQGSEDVREEPVFFQYMIDSLGLSVYTRELEGTTKVSIETDPPGAEVHCFRYRPVEARLYPMPYAMPNGAADRSERGEPLLEIAGVDDPARCPFRPGDRLLAVNGRRTKLLGDFAAALEGVAAGDGIEVKLAREGREMAVSWVPFPLPKEGEEPPFPAGSAVHTGEQFHFNFAGYPLDSSEANRAGPAAAGATLDLDLPRGSYLLVFRKPGYEEARVPVATPRKAEPLRVRLMRSGEMPEGFVYIPAGPFGYGGDRKAFQSLPYGEASLPAYFIARFEVTWREFEQFMNDPEVLARTDDDGQTRPADPESQAMLARAGRQTCRLVVKTSVGKTYWTREPGGKWTAQVRDKDVPVLVTHFAAREYAYWRTKTDGRGHRYRLPTDLEWEKAARGADRRIYVWGDYLVWSFSWSHHGIPRRPTYLARPGACPFDQSVYGVHDLAGSVCEHTVGRPYEASAAFSSVRGGSWYSPDEYFFRASTRNSRLPDGWGLDAGFRLVAEIPK